MAEDDTDEEETAEPAVELGTGPEVAGAPVARVAARLTWPAARADVLAQEGDASIRTPDGARELSSVLAESDEVYFESRQAFVAAVEDVVGTGPVATE